MHIHDISIFSINLFAELRKLVSTIQEAIAYFENQKLLHQEAALLSRCIYRMKWKFRTAKDMKTIEKLKKSLVTYLELDIVSTLKSFRYLIPAEYQSKRIYLPTKNMLDHILVRLQGLGMLLKRMMCTCRVSAVLSQKRLHLGHFWNMAVILLAIISRIYILVKDMIKYACDLYVSLRPFSAILKNTGAAWLPADYTLPGTLMDWLQLDWPEIANNVIEIPDDDVDADDAPLIAYFDLVDDSDDDDDDSCVEVSDEYVLVNDDDDEDETTIADNIDRVHNSTVNMLNGFVLDEENVDVGVEVIDNVVDVRRRGRKSGNRRARITTPRRNMGKQRKSKRKRSQKLN